MESTARPFIDQALATIGPVVREHADEGEQIRRLPLPVVEAMREAGIFRLLVPKSLGGHESDPLASHDLVEELARIDGSASWCAFIATPGPSVGRFASDEAAEAIFGDPATIIGGSVAPPGRAVPVDGGYRVSGRWTLASGCQHTTWTLAFCFVLDGDKPRLSPLGAPAMHGALVPSSAIKILDTWHVMGLQGTGSHDFVLDDHFVPASYFFPLAPGAWGQHYQGSLYRFPFVGLFGLPIASVATGLARQAIDTCLDLALSKVPRFSESTLREKPVFHYQLADAVASLEGGRAWLRQEVTANWERVQSGEQISMEQRGRMALAGSHAVRSAAHAVDQMYAAGGSTANYKSSPLQRCFRDMHALTQHFATNPQSVENAGRILSGLPTPNPLLLL
jgi:alkylation response protein AidB-like acyl-CoA dehydrogenase